MKKILISILGLILLNSGLFAQKDDITVARRMKMIIVDFESAFPENSILNGKTLADEFNKKSLQNKDILDKVYIIPRETLKTTDLAGYKMEDIMGVLQKGQLLNAESILAGKVTAQSNGLYEIQVQLIDIQKKNIPTTRRVLNFATAKDVPNEVTAILTAMDTMIATLVAGNFPRVDIITPNFDVVSIIQINKENFPEMRLNVNVVNAAGEPVSLPPELFEIRENGNMVMANVQKVKSTDLKTTPMTILLVIDRSPSMLEELDGRKTGQPFARAKAAAVEFMEKMSPGDKVKIIAFDYEPLELGDYTTDKKSYYDKLEKLSVGRGTGLYNVIAHAMKDISTQSGDRAVVLLTDGVNDVRNAKPELQKITLEDALLSVKGTSIPLYTIGFGGADEKVLNEVAKSSHSIYFKAASSEKLRELYLKLHNIIENQYVITYKSLADRTGKVSVDLNIKRDERGFDLTDEEQRKADENRKLGASKTESEIIQLQKKELASQQADVIRQKTEIEKKQKEIDDKLLSLSEQTKQNEKALEEIKKLKASLTNQNQALLEKERALNLKRTELEKRELSLTQKAAQLEKQRLEIQEIQGNIKKANMELLEYMKSKFEYLEKEKAKLEAMPNQSGVTQ